MAKILIVGYGYIGQPLAKFLVSKGNEIVAISRTNKHYTAGVTTIKSDIHDLDSLPDVDAVIYLISADAHNEEMYRKAYIEGPKKFGPSSRGKNHIAFYLPLVHQYIHSMMADGLTKKHLFLSHTTLAEKYCKRQKK